jgi:hypothetical protein
MLVFRKSPKSPGKTRLMRPRSVGDSMQSSNSVYGLNSCALPKFYPMGTNEPISLTAEAQLELDVNFNGKRHILNGKSDHSIWYDNQGMSTNLVIYEAKVFRPLATVKILAETAKSVGDRLSKGVRLKNKSAPQSIQHMHGAGQSGTGRNADR